MILTYFKKFNMLYVFLVLLDFRKMQNTCFDQKGEKNLQKYQFFGKIALVDGISGVTVINLLLTTLNM